MAEESPSGGERTEAPSGKRRQDFRKKGQVAQSKEVQTAALLTIMLLFWIFYMPTFLKNFTELLTAFWKSVGIISVTPSSVVNLAFFIGQEFAILLFPLFAMVLVVGFFASFFQIGWLFTTEPLIPDFKKFDPIKGFAKIFSKKSLLEIVKSLPKILLVGYLAYSTVVNRLEETIALVDTSAAIILAFIAKTTAVIFAKVCALLIFFAFIDFLYTRWEMEQKMKMTKQEVKEEFKEMEGDPKVKAQIRSIQLEMARKRMMAEVPEADVVITNPTHISVAIKYDAETMDAPMVIAKGTDLLAMKIREIARENDVPLVENPPVARLLHKLDLGATVPEELFKAVAEILAHVYSLKGTLP